MRGLLTEGETQILFVDPAGLLDPGVNSTAAEARLSLSFDATTLYISGDRAGGSGLHDLWVSTRSRLRGR